MPLGPLSPSARSILAAEQRFGLYGLKAPRAPSTPAAARSWPATNTDAMLSPCDHQLPIDSSVPQDSPR